MEVAVKNVINMMYSRDTSKKVRSARTTLAKVGKFIGPQAPCGTFALQLGKRYDIIF